MTMVAHACKILKDFAGLAGPDVALWHLETGEDGPDANFDGLGFRAG